MNRTWTNKQLIDLAKNHTSISEFRAIDDSAYRVILKRGIQDIALSHMAKKSRVTLQEATTEALKYKTRKEFFKKCPRSYKYAHCNGLLDQICKHMPPNNCSNKKPANFKWTHETIAEVAATCIDRTEFINKYAGAARAFYRLGVSPSIFDHMIYQTSTNPEKEVLAWVQSINPDFKKHKWGHKELDCYSDKLKIGIEYNGLYWHSEKGGRGRNYHLDKTKYFESIGIRVIYIWGHEWRDRQDQVKNYILSAIGANNIRIGARKCEFKEIPAKDARLFLNSNHIQGQPRNIKLAIGCFYLNQLISVATFGLHHRQGTSKSMILNRFACLPNHTVSGGLAKMSKLAFNKLGVLHSWADYAKSQGAGYIAAGWKLIKHLKVDYFYTKNGDYISKQSRQKQRIKTPVGMTESEHAALDNVFRVWDCGKLLLKYDPL